MEKCGKTKHIYIRMFLNEFPQPFQSIGMGFGLPHVKGDLMLHSLPFIHKGIVHVYRIPHDVGQKAHRIVMERDTLHHNLSLFFVIMPVRNRYHLPCAPVNHLPPSGNIVSGIGREHILIKSLHQ